MIKKGLSEGKRAREMEGVRKGERNEVETKETNNRFKNGGTGRTFSHSNEGISKTMRGASAPCIAPSQYLFGSK